MSRNDLKDTVSIQLCSAKSFYGTARSSAMVGSIQSWRSYRTPLQLGIGMGWPNTKMHAKQIEILRILDPRFGSLI